MAVAGTLYKGTEELASEGVSIVLLGVGIATFFAVMGPLINAGQTLKATIQSV
jgi:hypothetical protein